MSGLAINSASAVSRSYHALDARAALTLESSSRHVNASTYGGLSSLWGGTQADLATLLNTFSLRLSELMASLQQVLPQPGALADLSSKRNGAQPDHCWVGFRQGPTGNCVTVAAIKAAMLKFGQSPTDIFQGVSKEGNGYRVVMRDGYSLHVSRGELAQAARASRFVSRDKEVLKDAHFLFAVSAKRAQLENNDGYARRGFGFAIYSLNEGEDEDENKPGEALLRLGLGRYIKRVPVSELARGELGVVNCGNHSAVVINGVEEYYGRRGKIPVRGDAIAFT
ncbi:hypothetical protein [Pseudomonas syringae]